MPSMSEAAEIRDVAARHRYVFDNGLVDPGLFDLEQRMQSEEFALLLEYILPEHSVFEVGCLTGLNLLGLAEHGYRHLTGIDFVAGALQCLRRQRGERQIRILQRDFLTVVCGQFDRLILYDVLEHQLNVGHFLEHVCRHMKDTSQALILVPQGRQCYDCGHVAFFPDEECLTNVLKYFMAIGEMRTLNSGKLFARCELH